ncbi:hypothetical protein Tco_0485357 [Tanacetum coccineum]
MEMEINSSDRNPRPSGGNSPAQASGSRGAVKKVTNNPTSHPPDLGPTEDDVADGPQNQDPNGQNLPLYARNLQSKNRDDPTEQTLEIDETLLLGFG